MSQAFWGPGYSREEIRRAIDSNELAQKGCEIAELKEGELMRRTAVVITDGHRLLPTHANGRALVLGDFLITRQ
ncbi:MAG: hypothetical protein DMG38_23195 [Acidobacteria bacterium]|nr:MAG: hypothetical protein DMG38_23195 [Acidobacteriota bacterium]